MGMISERKSFLKLEAMLDVCMCDFPRVGMQFSEEGKSNTPVFSKPQCSSEYQMQGDLGTLFLKKYSVFFALVSGRMSVKRQKSGS